MGKFVGETRVILPIPPSVNNLYTGMGKARRKNGKYAAWSDEAGWRINEARSKGTCRNIKRGCWYWTDIRLPEHHAGDSDNRLKALHDLLHTMGVTPDDKWLLGGTYIRSSDVDSGTCVVSAVSVESANLSRWEQIRFIADRMIQTDQGHIKDIGSIPLAGQIS